LKIIQQRDVIGTVLTRFIIQRGIESRTTVWLRMLWLNFSSVHSCSQNISLISCSMSA